MAQSCEHVLERMHQKKTKGSTDQSDVLRKLDPKQRKALELFQEFDTITAKQIGDLFGFQPRTSSALCKKWVDNNFLEITDFSNKGRKYKLAKQYKHLKG